MEKACSYPLVQMARLLATCDLLMNETFQVGPCTFITVSETRAGLMSAVLWTVGHTKLQERWLPLLLSHLSRACQGCLGDFPGILDVL